MRRMPADAIRISMPATAHAQPLVSIRLSVSMSSLAVPALLCSSIALSRSLQRREALLLCLCTPHCAALVQIAGTCRASRIMTTSAPSKYIITSASSCSLESAGNAHRVLESIASGQCCGWNGPSVAKCCSCFRSWLVFWRAT